MTWLLIGWAAGAAVAVSALAWSSRYRRDRHRPTGGSRAVFGGLIGFLEIVNPQTYDADRAKVVVRVMWAAAIVSAILLFTGLMIATSSGGGF